MNYNEDDLIDFIAQHDENEDYYREKLAELRAAELAEAWEKGKRAGRIAWPRQRNPYKLH